MQLTLKKPGLKLLLPTLSFVCLALALALFGSNIVFTPKKQSFILAKFAIAEGQEITRDLLESVEVPVGLIGENYLGKFEPGLFALHSIGEGQFLAKGNLERTADKRIQVRINNLPPISSSISVGDLVDVWATSNSQVQPGSPEPVAYAAIVFALEKTSNMSQQSTNVELRILPDYLETFLAAVDSNSKISLILHETLSDLG